MTDITDIARKFIKFIGNINCWTAKKIENFSIGYRYLNHMSPDTNKALNLRQNAI